MERTKLFWIHHVLHITCCTYRHRTRVGQSDILFRDFRSPIIPQIYFFLKVFFYIKINSLNRPPERNLHPCDGLLLTHGDFIPSSHIEVPTRNFNGISWHGIFRQTVTLLVGTIVFLHQTLTFADNRCILNTMYDISIIELL